jgi:hypothetical protein
MPSAPGTSGVAATDSALAPPYGERTVGEVLPSALGCLGVPGWPNPLGLPAARAVVVLLVDGLGALQLAEHRALAPTLAGMADRPPLMTGLPSTTATSLTSLGTGVAPGLHGLVGYTSRRPGSDDALLNALTWDDSVDPVGYQPLPTVFERAVDAGVAVTAASKPEFRTSGLTRAGMRGGRYVGVLAAGERAAVAASAAAGRGPSLTYVYDADLDMVGHRWGVASDAWRLQLGLLDGFVETLMDLLPPDALLVVTGDHGMVDVPAEERVDVEDDPRLLTGVRLVAGEARFRHVYTAPEQADAVAARWQEALGAGVLVRTREQAVAAGWFGAVDARVAPRLGDVVAAVTTGPVVMHRRLFPMEQKLVGFHGGPTPAETLVPLALHAGSWVG